MHLKRHSYSNDLEHIAQYMPQTLVIKTGINMYLIVVVRLDCCRL